MGIFMKKVSLEPQKLVILTNAILLAVGAMIQGVDSPARDIIMSGLFTVWVGTFIWYVMASQNETA